MENRPVSVIIFADGQVEIVGQVSVGAIRVAIQRLQAALDQVMVGPQPMPQPAPDDDNE